MLYGTSTLSRLTDRTGVSGNTGDLIEGITKGLGSIVWCASELEQEGASRKRVQMRVETKLSNKYISLIHPVRNQLRPLYEPIPAPDPDVRPRVQTAATSKKSEERKR